MPDSTGRHAAVWKQRTWTSTCSGKGLARKPFSSYDRRRLRAKAGAVGFKADAKPVADDFRYYVFVVVVIDFPRANVHLPHRTEYELR